MADPGLRAAGRIHGFLNGDARRLLLAEVRREGRFGLARLYHGASVLAGLRRWDNYGPDPAWVPADPVRLWQRIRDRVLFDEGLAGEVDAAVEAGCRDPQDPTALARASLHLHPRSTPARITYAACLIQGGRFEEALPVLHRALHGSRREEWSARIARNFAAVHYALGDRDACRRWIVRSWRHHQRVEPMDFAHYLYRRVLHRDPARVDPELAGLARADRAIVSGA